MGAGGPTSVVTGALWLHGEYPQHSSRLLSRVTAVGVGGAVGFGRTLFRQSWQEL